MRCCSRRELRGSKSGDRAGRVRSCGTHYSNAEVVRMAVRSRAAYLEQPYYERCGWLFLVDEEGAEPARRNREMQLREGALSDEVDPADFGVSSEGVAYALYEPDSGFADPVAATRAFVELLGAREPRRAKPRRSRRSSRAAACASAAACSRRTTSCSRRGRGRRSSPQAIGLDLPLEFPREQDVVFDTGGRRRPRTRSRRRSTVCTCVPRAKAASSPGAAIRRTTSSSIPSATTRRSTTRSRPTSARACRRGCRG